MALRTSQQTGRVGICQRVCTFGHKKCSRRLLHPRLSQPLDVSSPLSPPRFRQILPSQHFLNARAGDQIRFRIRRFLDLWPSSESDPTVKCPKFAAWSGLPIDGGFLVFEELRLNGASHTLLKNARRYGVKPIIARYPPFPCNSGYFRGDSPRGIGNLGTQMPKHF
jgi:hypothetical protein